MSAKIAVIIGDYSNGWSDAWVVQAVGKFSQQDLSKDKGTVMAIMQSALLDVVDQIEDNKKVNPPDPKAPCCAKFKAWAKDFADKMEVGEKRLNYCPHCGAMIHDEAWEEAIGA